MVHKIYILVIYLKYKNCHIHIKKNFLLKKIINKPNQQYSKTNTINKWNMIPFFIQNIPVTIKTREVGSFFPRCTEISFFFETNMSHCALL